MSATPALAGGESLPLPPRFRYVDPLEGLGGWLILVAIQLLLAPLLIMFTIFTVDIPLLFGVRARDYLSLHQGLTAVVTFETLTNIVFLFLLGFLIVLFFRKKRSFPTYMIFFYVLQSVVILADHFWFVAVAPELANKTGSVTLIRPLMAALVWVPYFLLSERVKVTFTH